MKDKSRYLIVPEKVMFTHDDRSIRPIIMIKTNEEIYKCGQIQKVKIAMFDFKNMRIPDSTMEKNGQTVSLKN